MGHFKHTHNSPLSFKPITHLLYLKIIHHRSFPSELALLVHCACYSFLSRETGDESFYYHHHYLQYYYWLVLVAGERVYKRNQMFSIWIWLHVLLVPMHYSLLVQTVLLIRRECLAFADVVSGKWKKSLLVIKAYRSLLALSY